MSDVDQLTEAFRRNGRTNDALLGLLTPDDLALSDGQGGMSVGQMLEHMLGGRRGYLERVGSPAAQQITVQTEEGDQPFWKVTLDIAQLRVAFTQADAAVLSGVQDAERGLQRFRQHFVSHPAQLLALLLVHDANHRGQITVLLRQGGRPEGTLNRLAASTWSIWRE